MNERLFGYLSQKAAAASQAQSHLTRADSSDKYAQGLTAVKPPAGHMSDRQERPFSAASRLESAKPLNSTSPVNRLLARSQSQSPADARRYQSSISRTQALDDSAKHHSSPSKSRSFRQQAGRQSPLPQSSSKSYSCAKLLAAVVLMSWQVLIVLILAFTLRTTQQINARIVQQGEGS